MQHISVCRRDAEIKGFQGARAPWLFFAFMIEIEAYQKMTTAR